MKNKINITYCPGCRWLTRASWMSQELLITFEKNIDEVSLSPSPEAGTFKVFVNGELVHCRKQHNGFPELKILKQKIRNLICPEKDLGHSDQKTK
ncbi:SelT/selW/selH selenoprotein [Lentisphaera araneosa HTCC2155]|uniref:SelT/selW/selH selenoprotein n=1 Tax=Lentisphaera araneosa HTCC2155 TaxID=313628 RepID=A6DQP0_9BACT|nr:SelT/SelW/SelH family protein [Lentisphaera araneosa]EDM26121.1 SelT/selW/selH selenoprotein [Lentisphaera araneosa HTCC2155]